MTRTQTTIVCARTSSGSVRVVDVDALLEWYERVRRPLPWRATRDPYALLVSRGDAPADPGAAGRPVLRALARRASRRRARSRTRPCATCSSLWSGLGYNRRALALQNAARVVAVGRLAVRPDDAAGRRAVHGGGGRRRSRGTRRSRPWTRTCAACSSRRDGVVHTPRALAARAAALLPAGRAATFNQAMMELGATVCRPRAPLCGACPVVGGLRAVRCRRRRAVVAAVRFEDTDRWARGRIVAALLAGEELPVRGRAARARAGRARARRAGRSRTRRIGVPSVTCVAPSARALSSAVVDRDRIERRDFPTGRRGYDPAAVDEHLRRVADEFEARVAPAAAVARRAARPSRSA